MAVTHRGTSAAAAASGATVTIAKPAGVVDGDFLIICLASTLGITVIPSGWVQRVTAGAMGVYTKTASAEPASWVFTLSGSGASAMGVCIAYSGADPNPYDTSSGNIGSGTAATSLSINTAGPNEMIVNFAMQLTTATWSPPAGWTERFDGNLGGWTMEIAEAFFVAGGSVGNQVATSTVSSAWDAVMLAIKPPGGSALFFGSL